MFSKVLVATDLSEVSDHFMCELVNLQASWNARRPVGSLFQRARRRGPVGKHARTGRPAP